MLNLVLFGPPGAGKGTQSQKLIEKHQLVHLSTGDLLRQEISKETILGKEAKKLMDQGLLVSDKTVTELINNKLDANKNANGFVFDGFPRTVAQAQVLDDLLLSKGFSISGMISLEVGNTELEARLLLRGKGSCRPDDANPEVIRRRISEYNQKTTAVADFYKSQNKFECVSGVGSVDDIFFSICQVVDGFKSKVIS